MSVMRAILARFARLLVRLAGVLDPGVSSIPHVAKAERMATLRRRYPGAPDHWLRLLADKVAVSEVEAPLSQPEQELSAETALPSTSEQSPPTQPKWFSRPSSRMRVQFAEASITGARAPTQPVTDKRSRRRRPPEFQPAERQPNRIAILFGVHRGGKRKAAVSFDAENTRRRAEAEPPREAPTRTRPDLCSSYPEPAESLRPEIRFGESSRSADRNSDDKYWPERPATYRADPSWPRPTARTRAVPDFVQYDRRWPDLPTAPQEDLRIEDVLRDEAALRAEQIGGAWSE